MKNTLRILGFSSLIILILIFAIPAILKANSKDLNVKIHLRGVNKSKISITPLGGSRNVPLAVLVAVKNNETADFKIPERYLPGEFLIRFEYFEAEHTTRPTQTEKMIIINKQNIEMWANPIFINNMDSTYFGAEEKENNAFNSFMIKNMQSLEMLDVIQNFLLKYDDTDSDFYRSGIDEFNKRRNAHNLWVDSEIGKYEDLFASIFFMFYYVPEVNWGGNKIERQMSLIDNYFYGMNFKNKDLLKISYLKTWMDSYVNLYSELVDGPERSDSIFTLAGYNAIEAVKSGNPYVYGWMVDYFFNGYESLDLQNGIKMLAPYIADPNCKTSKRIEIERRLAGIQQIVPGTISPDFHFTTRDGKKTSLHKFKPEKPYKLVMFWSADCGHCVDLGLQLNRYFDSNRNKLDIIAISLDETQTEIPKWEDLSSRLANWHHILATGGINSPEANLYYILSTPSLFLINTKDNVIVGTPTTIKQLEDLIK